MHDCDAGVGPGDDRGDGRLCAASKQLLFADVTAERKWSFVVYEHLSVVMLASSQRVVSAAFGSMW